MSADDSTPSLPERAIAGLLRAARRIRTTVEPALRVAVAAAVRIGYRDIVTTSSHLSYLTMFGLVPLLVLTLAIMRPLGLLEDTHQVLHAFLVSTGISTIRVPIALPPTDSQPGRQNQATVTVDLASEIERIVDQILQRLTVERVGPAGVLVDTTWPTSWQKNAPQANRTSEVLGAMVTPFVTMESFLGERIGTAV